MSFKTTLKQLLPEPLLEIVRKRRKERSKKLAAMAPPLSKDRLVEIVNQDLGVKRGDVLFVHSGMSSLNLSFPREEVLPLLLDILGPSGTILFPTYPKLGSAEFLLKGEVFDVRKTPSYTGYLTEQARVHPDARRSLHPIKSVAAIGALAEELTATHPDSPYPYDACSPYYKIIPHGGRIVGLGVASRFLSFVHCVDDFLKNDFPVEPYLPTLFEAPCINAAGEIVIVKTYAHDPEKMTHDVVKYFAQYISASIAKDLIIDGKPFFYARAPELFQRMVGLARENITIFAKRSHKTGMS